MAKHTKNSKSRKEITRQTTKNITVCDDNDDDLDNYNFENDPTLIAKKERLLETLKKAPYPGTYVKNGKIYKKR